VYAIFEDRSKQYKVSEGQVLDLDLQDLAEGAETIEFDRVLMVGEGAETKIGKPTVAGAKVIAKIERPMLKGPKVEVVHFIRRKGHLTRQGHRQRYTRVKIEKIVV